MNDFTKLRHADLRRLSTFQLPARADRILVIERPEQLEQLPRAEGPELILSGGSNTIFLGDYHGRILLSRLRGLVFEEIQGRDTVRVRVAAGESWHGLVRRCLDRGLHGLENLALIPGSVGAAPIQNIGAYGVELDQVFESLTAWDLQQRRWVDLNREDCAFAYRDSRFKSEQPGRYFITEVRLRLSRQFRPCLDYGSLNDALKRANLSHPTPRELVATILRLRRHRLPDPRRLSNAGSFFKNPIVDEAQAAAALRKRPGIPHWRLSDGRYKLAAGAIIEHLGFKGKRLDGVGVYQNHALVLVNYGDGTSPALTALVKQICSAVKEEFGIVLDCEPQLIEGAAR